MGRKGRWVEEKWGGIGAGLWGEIRRHDSGGKKERRAERKKEREERNR